MADIIEEVQKRYAAVARSKTSSAQEGVRAVAQAFGYAPEELAAIPAEANMGLSCGNPTAFARLRPGETVVDLGCGGGLDVLLAAPRLGPTGKAIGIDMTPEMIERAKRNAAKQGVSNVEFHLAKIDQLPLQDSSADCIISNCVINLVPQKSTVFREMFRVLKPGGRVAVSDIALKKPLPAEINQNLLAYIGCIAGAILIEDYIRQLESAGFEAVQVIDTRKDLNAYANLADSSVCCGPAQQGSASSCCSTSEPASDWSAMRELLRKYNVNDYAASVQVYALKPQ